MKTKILLTSALALAISAPAMAVDPTQTPTTVTSTSSCTETTLGTATGPVDIEADWQANTINLTWDANNGTVSGGPEQCTYDGTFTLPTSITRTGYEFAGWLVKNGPAQCSASVLGTLNASQPITYFASIGLNTTFCTGWDTTIEENNGWFGVDKGGSCSDPAFANLTPGEWEVTGSYGTLKGKAVCAKNGGTYAQTGTPKGTGGNYCWCQPTSYTPAGGEMCTVNSSSSWVFAFFDVVNAADCANICPDICAVYARNDADFRAGLFGSVAN